MVHSLILAASQPGDNLVPLYYITAIIISVGTGIWGLSRWFEKQRTKWQQEATHDAHISEELAANTAAAMKNTAAITLLTQEMGAFAQRVDKELNGHGNRISRLEEYAEYGTAPYHFKHLRELNGDE